MTILLQDKIELLKNIDKDDVWYIVKQDVGFIDKLKQVSLFQKIDLNSNVSLAQQFENLVIEHNEKTGDKVTSVHRSLRIAYYYGLLTSDEHFRNYGNMYASEAFEYIENIANRNFNILNGSNYSYLIRNQIEKIFLKSLIDESSKNTKNTKLFPVIFLYKILLELGKKYGDYSISILEYQTLIITTNTAEEFIDTILQIVQLRNTPEKKQELERLREAQRQVLDNRFIVVLKELDTLKISNDKIELNLELIDHIKDQVYYAEKIEYNAKEYISFLASKKTFKDLVKEKEEKVMKEELSREFINNYDQKIFFGPPGTGKSYAANMATQEDILFKTTIFPDYDYHTFTGSIMPVVNNGNITYDFNPGIFTKALAAAFLNPDKRVSLIIDEMTRGNIAGIFGDIFQLLDRDIEGISESSINNDLIAKYIKETGVVNLLIEQGKIYLPSNFSIIGTINTSDQNVFVMDTAFKRRFMFEYVGLDAPVSEDGYINDYNFKFEDGEEISWVNLYQNINKFIMHNLKMPEDKQVGPFFIKFEGLSLEQAYQQLSNKLLLYLWEDIETVKFNSSESLFDIDDNEVTFEKLYNLLNKSNPQNIFNNSVVPKSTSKKL